MGRYGYKLGPTYDWLVSEKGATNMEIINSSSRPNANINKLLSGLYEIIIAATLHITPSPH